MNEKLVHRGPDDFGTWSGPTIAVGMRRLSILDLPTGRQPIFNEDGSLLIVFNGEIYNHVELRSRLTARGHHFRTQSDTEVILHAYEEYGEDTPRHLHGMFAFCIVNIAEQSLFLARDRFGEKPLYFWHSGNRFAFASEIASLLEWSEIPRKLDLDSLGFFLRQMFPSPSKTLFRDIQQLLPGHNLIWRNGWRNVQRYYHPVFNSEPTMTEEDSIESVKNAIVAAVGRQRLADVPVGALLSGGIDSSIIVAALAQQSSQISTYTARFEHAEYDESAVARRTAEFLGTNHHEVYIPNHNFEPEDLLRIVRHVGQPFVDSSAIPTYLVCKEISKSVKVCLSGDGGDEMFAGYDYFQICQLADRMGRSAPKWCWKLLELALRGVVAATFLAKKPSMRKLRRIIECAQTPIHTRPRNVICLFDERDIRTYLHSHVLDSVQHPDFVDLDGLISRARNGTRLRQLMAHRIGFDLPEDMLTKVDRMSMAASLEVRAPFLDVGVAEAAAKLPDAMLVRGKKLKYVLRQVGRQWLPKELFNRPKTGFSIPLQRFFNKQFAGMSRDLLFAPDSLTRQLFRDQALEAIYSRGLLQGTDNAYYSVFRSAHQVWGLTQLAAWANEFKVTI